MAMADESNLDLCGGQDKTNAVANHDYKSDSGNQWQLPDITDPPSCFSQEQSVQQPLPLETSISVNVDEKQIKDPAVDTAETAFSQEVEVRIGFTFTINWCESRIFLGNSPEMINRNHN